MNKIPNMVDTFPKHHFWSGGMSKLNLARDKKLISPRALFAEATFIDDIERLENLYSKRDSTYTKGYQRMYRQNGL